MKIVRLALCLVACSASGAFAAEIIDRVLAIAAGDVITLTDVRAAKELRLLARAPGDEALSEREILTRLIDRALMLAEVERYGPPEPEEAMLARDVAAVRATFQTDEAFALSLARVGYDERHLREILRQNLRIRAYLEQRFTVPPLSEEELTRYYREHQAAFTREGRVLALEDAREEIVKAATSSRREATISQWVAGLRRRAEVVDLTSGADGEKLGELK